MCFLPCRLTLSLRKLPNSCQSGFDVTYYLPDVLFQVRGFNNLQIIDHSLVNMDVHIFIGR